jgi:cyclohexyl-isocyanide hydratase
LNRRHVLQVSALSAAAAAVGYQLGHLRCRALHPDSRTTGTREPPDSSGGPPRAEILMLVYPRFTALDLIGPQHVFALLGPGYKTRLVWKDTQEVISDTGIPVRPTQSFGDTTETPAVIFVPGGTDGTLAIMEDPDVLAFLSSRGGNARFVTSVCTGSLVLAAAGLLEGRRATTHWLALDSLKRFGVEPVAERVVVDGNRVTGAGVTAGIDFALTLAATLMDESYAKGIELMMEYDPEPPFGSGSPGTAEPETVELLKAMVLDFNRDVSAIASRRQDGLAAPVSAAE